MFHPANSIPLALPILLESRTQFFIEPGPLAAKFLYCRSSFHFEIRLATVEMIEATRNFTRKLDVWHLILAHRHKIGTVDKYVGSLQQRVAKKTVGR